MSVREVSQANSGTKSQHNYRKLRKFTFTDLTLSFQVRKRLYEMIISFDDNVNYQFEKQEIRKALIEILDENESQIAYVLNNVFRYDTNHDGIVTYEEFSNFCLEQHFGEMAIQRLHKRNVYSRGKERLMSNSEFNRTIQYCLSFINIKPPKESLDIIFNDLDLDRDGYITYVQYFTFLKEYFGSQSQSASTVTVSKVEEDLKKIYGNVDRNQMKQEIFKDKKQKLDQNKVEKKVVQIKKQIKQQIKQQAKQKPTSATKNSTQKTQELNNIGQRISRLIYHQLKLKAMQHDRQMLLCSSQEVAQQFLINSIKIPKNRARQIISEAFQRQETITYEKLLKYAVQKFMCEDAVNRITYNLIKQKFVSEIIQNLYFVRAKPFTFSLQQLFDKYTQQDKSKAQINRNQFKQLMNIIFNSYNWPRKTGQLRKKQPLLPTVINQRIIRF